MYTILVNNDNTLTTSVKERIMQRSKLVDSLHFLVEPIYKEFDMSDFTVLLEYILPISKEYKTEILIKSDELYKNKLEYKVPFDTELTKEAGEIEVKLTFSKVDLDEEGNDIQYVRKVSSTSITIVPLESWCSIIPDKALESIDQRIIKTDAQIKALLETQETAMKTKADNIIIDEESGDVYLTANGNKIGNGLRLANVTVSDDDDLIDGIVDITNKYPTELI